ncbi:hypothetical protein DXG01_010325 [Tephrocybe rancida]|nr:hypothetical protein DXG01_010325 [Tephrocybe rancida]
MPLLHAAPPFTPSHLSPQLHSTLVGTYKDNSTTMPEAQVHDVPATPTTSTDSARFRSDLAEYERSESRPVFVLSRSELKLLGIAGPVATMLQYRLYGGHSLPSNLEGFMKAGANIGSVIGQFAFGYAADALGRKAVYGKELMLIILATVLTITTPTGTLSPDNCLIYLGMFRILLGVGVGGDYPMSASVTSDRSNLRKRGTMLAYIFSNQGWGSLMGSLVTIIVLACYRHVMDDEGKTSKVDGVWRIVVGVSLVPAFGTLYQRLTLPESTRFLASQKLVEEGQIEPDIKRLNGHFNKESRDASISATKTSEKPEVVAQKKAHFKGNLHVVLAVSFPNVVLQQIGFDGTTGTPWHRLFKIATGNIIITALGFVPGYWASVLLIEKLGRRWIQIQGFLLAALFLAITAGKFTELSTASFVVCFALLQFFFNFGANTTTYCYPAEGTFVDRQPDDAALTLKIVFPTRYRATAHGISAAAGKCGAIISALAFNTLSKDIGTPAVLWSKFYQVSFYFAIDSRLMMISKVFFGCCIGGAVFTLLLPEVKGRDPDLILAEEIREAREKAAGGRE